MFNGGLRIVAKQCLSESAVRDPWEPASSGMQLRVLPNPISEWATIRFETPAGGRARVDVFDPSGRRVRTLSDGMLGAGIHQLGWDGRDGNGSAVAAGVYLVRASAGGQTTAGRIVVVR